MDRRLPPSSKDVSDYLAFLSARIDTEGSAADARGAIGFIAAFRLMARYTDMSFVRLDSEKVVVSDTHVRVLTSCVRRLVYRHHQTGRLLVQRL